ncbi:MAG: hypothetical protein GKB98_02885 [Methanobacteriales archaeon]|nr:hypothetical protein [Methanobacteriales archaeon]
MPTVSPPNLDPPDIEKDDPATFARKWWSYYIGNAWVSEIGIQNTKKRVGYGPNAGYERLLKVLIKGRAEEISSVLPGL